MEIHNCRVCGFYIENLPWGEAGNCPTYEICPCCGVEFGNEDYTIESVKKYRNEWLSKDGYWFDPDEKPNEWSLDEQLKSIPKKIL